MFAEFCRKNTSNFASCVKQRLKFPICYNSIKFGAPLNFIRIIKHLLQSLKISRPGLWFPTIWIYLVPFQIASDFWEKPFFWIGLFFVSFPLNFLVYGLNDFTDGKADSLNPRKGNFLFGAKYSKKKLTNVPWHICLVIIPFLAFFAYVGGSELFILLLFMVVINIIYNYKPFRLKERPPFEILIQAGYVFTALFSITLNDLEMLPWQTFLYLTLFAFQAHIAGEIMDIEPDILAKKKTTAVIIGRKKAKLLMLSILLFEVYILKFWFDDLVMAGFLAAFSLWLILDIFIFFKNRPYTLKQMKLFGIFINISAILSMIWVLYSGNLLHPNF
ncbi:UbiA family prenyltransferase [Aequorivita sp. SDUM287046]|uniref:UbiA family prenyltransferase n=1 Tax=Aequorivita aurantiaca TaxID=3053356 RepID=A0ABT8DII9_9FLAO|nr:UbiA family prenyltransferase [Aequorivita aurantiaca]MDN3722812.1 UbiA family prenyltransferase [Aequorivita aurantiaca]